MAAPPAEPQQPASAEQADTALPSTEDHGDQTGASATQAAASNETVRLISSIFQNWHHTNLGSQDGSSQEADISAPEAGDAQPIKQEDAEPANGEKVEGDDKEADADNQEGQADQENQALSNAAPGFNNVNGAFPNMNFGASGNMDQMQMMMDMQNGMPAGAFGAGFPMMGSFYPCSYLLPVTLHKQTR